MAGNIKLLFLSSITIAGILYFLCIIQISALDTHISNNEDINSFFEGSENQEETEELSPHREQNILKDEIKEINESKEQPKYYAPSAPVFETSTEKFIYYFRKYLVEISLLMLVAVYLLNFVVGKRVNQKVVSMWLVETVPTLDNNFAMIGFGEESNLSLSQIKYDQFEFYATGRDNCKYIFMSMITKRRQDVITGGLLTLLWPDADKIIIDIPIDAELPLEFIICRNFNIKKTQQEMPHINNLVSRIPVEKLNETNLAVLSESNEIPDMILSNKIIASVIKLQKYIEFLHITDQKVYTQYNLVLKAEILFGDKPSEYKESAKCIDLILDIVDQVATNVKLPERILDLTKKNRSAEVKKREKEEREKKEQEIQQKKEEKERELREKLKKMDPEERRKMENRIKKDSKRKELKGNSKVIKF